jgi:hypothetical protein
VCPVGTMIDLRLCEDVHRDRCKEKQEQLHQAYF